MKIEMNLISLRLFKVGAEIVRKSLSYPLKLIAKNAGVNGSVVTEKVRTRIYVLKYTFVVQKLARNN